MSCLSKMPSFSLPFANWRSAEQRSIVILGLPGSGRTTFFRKLMDDKDARPPPPTIAYNAVSLTWSNEKYTLVDTGGDGLDHRGSQAKRQFLCRYSLVLYIHDCSDDGNISESVRVLHAHLNDLVRAGVRHLWVILNKQDLTRQEKKQEKGHARAAKEHFELDLKWYSDQILWRVVDLPGTSGFTGCRLDDIKQLIPPAFLSKFEPKTPAPKSPPVAVVVIPQRRISFSFSSDDQFGKLSSDEFWKCVLVEEPTSIQHGTRVRAAYFIMLESLRNNRGLIETANDTQSLEWLQFDPNHRGNRYAIFRRNLTNELTLPAQC